MHGFSLWGIGWVDGEPKAGSSRHRVFIEVHKQLYTITCQVDTDANSSLPPGVALSVHPRGTI